MCRTIWVENRRERDSVKENNKRERYSVGREMKGKGTAGTKWEVHNLPGRRRKR